MVSCVQIGLPSVYNSPLEQPPRVPGKCAFCGKGVPQSLSNGVSTLHLLHLTRFSQQHRPRGSTIPISERETEATLPSSEALKLLFLLPRILFHVIITQWTSESGM